MKMWKFSKLKDNEQHSFLVYLWGSDTFCVRASRYTGVGHCSVYFSLGLSTTFIVIDEIISTLFVYTNLPHRRCYGNKIVIIMAIIQCPNCGNSVSDRAAQCPKCGYGINAQSQPTVDNSGLEWYLWIVFLCVGWIFSLIYYFVQKKKAPVKAKHAMICSVINFVFWILTIIVSDGYYY